MIKNSGTWFVSSFMRRILVYLVAFAIVGSIFTLPLTAQSQQEQRAAAVKEKARKRADDRSRTKVKLFSEASYVGVVSDVGESTFTITDKGGSKYSVQYSEVKSIGGTGWGSGAKIGLGIAIGAGVVLGVLAAIVASND